MAVVLDTGIVYAYYDRSDRWHEAALELLRRDSLLVLPAPIIAEVDHLLGRRLGRSARYSFYQGLTGEHYLIVDLSREGYERASELDRRYADFELGFVDAAVLAIAEEQGVQYLVTTDRRDLATPAADLGLEVLP